MVKKRSAAELPHGWCTRCQQKVAWPAPGSDPVTEKPKLFPLVCGHALCRSCLVQNVQVTLSSRLVPLHCCKREIPHDYIREVIEPEEDVYYSFLLRPAVTSENEENVLVPRTVNKTPYATPVRQDIMINTVATEDHKPEVRTRRSTASNSTKRGVIEASNSPRFGAVSVRPAEEVKDSSKRGRVATRGTDGRFISQKAHALEDAEISVAPSTTLQLSGVASSPEFCHVCSTTTVMYTLRFELPCHHILCRNCLTRQVSEVLARNKDGTDLNEPAGCCGHPLPLELVQRVTSRSELTKYKRLMAQFETVTSQASSLLVSTKTLPANFAPRSTGKTTKRKAASASRASAKRAKTAKAKETKPAPECGACFSTVESPDEWFLGPCGHGYCLSCLTEMAKLSLTDRSKVPIRCCSTEMPLEYVARVLKGPKISLYKRFLREQDPKSSTLKSDHVYAEVVRQVNGKQCPVCGIGIVKTDGCQIVVCAQGHTFCWGCGEKRCICAGSRQGRTRTM